MIEIKNLYLSFTKEYDALHNVSLSIKDGQKVALVGDTDSGKTMLLRTIAGLEKFESGEVILKNININKIDFKQDISVGFVPKSFVLLNNKTVKENLEYVLKIRNIDRATINLKVLTALKYFGIESIQTLKVKDLSNYQKILLQLARVSMRKIDLFLIDDIFESLTDSERVNVMAKLKILLTENENSTFIFAFRDSKFAEELNLDIVKLKYGCVIN